MSKNISFRVSENLHKELSKRARAEGKALGGFVRELVAESLDSDSSLDSLKMEISDVKHGLRQARIDLQNHLMATLHYTAQFPVEKARDVSKQIILRTKAGS